MERERTGRNPNLKVAIAAGIAGLLATGALVWLATQRTNRPETETPRHDNITATVFWVGEGANESNANIHNRSSAWVEDWVGTFGGVDDPENRCDLLPCGFAPQENPFYFALPYNDLDASCNAKPTQTEIPWYDGPPPRGHSIVKDHWARIEFAGKVAFAQWEDAGPFGEDDFDYVFGDKTPGSNRAGIDLSPATAEYLGINGRGQVSWEFIDESDVPDGPWRQTITRTPPDCAT